MINLKNILPIECNYMVKNLLIKKEKNLLLETDDTKKHVYFVDAPGYGNIGDQAIAFAMEKFVEDYFPEYIQVEITEDKIYSYLKLLKERIQKHDIICLTGGGNMGITYQRYEAIRRIIIKNFPDNLIFIFPQTIDYGSSKYGYHEKKRASKIYNKHKKLTIMARENKSYETMKNIFNKCNILLCPDIVLYLDYTKKFDNKRKKVGICLRDDKEKTAININYETIIKKYGDCQIISTVDNNISNITNLSRKKIVEKKLQEIASNKYFITDRLHGMIFAYITNTTCIALPNSNGKVERVFEWIKEKGNIKFEKELSYSFKESHKTNIMLKKEFEILAKKIRKKIEEEEEHG